MKNTRTNNSIKNSIASIVVYILNILMTFLMQSVFIRTLGAEYNGVKGLFTNILSMLSIAELGFGSAIVYNLYRPMAEKNEDEIKTLVNFYKNVYHIIAGVTLAIGILLLPVVPYIVGEVSIPENINLLFMLYLLNTVASYLLTYKRSVLYADQKNYITNIVSSIMIVIKNVVQILIIYLTKNFILFLICQIAFTILENISINIIVNARYKYVKSLKNVKPISKNVKQDIITKVKGLLFHKIGGFVVLGTDNIIISMTKGLGVITVGLYSNYYLIINSVKTLFGTVLSSLTASVGNLLIEKDKSKARNIYKSMLLLNSWIFCFGAAGIYCMIEPFIKIWIGEEYILSKFVLIVLVINLYVQGMRVTTNTFKEAAGIFYEDRFVPLLESLINIVASLIFVQFFGLAGVFIGTITSTMILFFYSYPKYVYKLVLNGKVLEYFKLHIKHFLITIIAVLVTGYVSSLIVIENVVLKLVVNGLVCIVLPNVIYMLFAIRMPEFEFYKEKIYTILNKK